MPVRQRGNSWQVDVRKKGIRFRHSYQTEDQANVMLAKVEEAISLGKALLSTLAHRIYSAQHAYS